MMMKIKIVMTKNDYNDDESANQKENKDGLHNDYRHDYNFHAHNCHPHNYQNSSHHNFHHPNPHHHPVVKLLVGL